MRIGLLGYGKMGHAIEQLLPEHQASLAWAVGRTDRDTLTLDKIRMADVVIEFSQPEAAFRNVMQCLDAGVPIVCGTTGWSEQLRAVHAHCEEVGGSFLWASNFSIGVQLFFELNRHLARLMAQHHAYTPELTEIHHTQKLDAPSGTAVTIAEDAQHNAPRIGNWRLTEAGPLPEDTWPIHSIREGQVPGTHEMMWKSAIDSISIKHEAHGRTGFAHGAILSALWLKSRKGVFTMRDVLGL
jgi:4-hydroxy-tetrahydrodipicolinate reductase